MEDDHEVRADQSHTTASFRRSVPDYLSGISSGAAGWRRGSTSLAGSAASSVGARNSSITGRVLTISGRPLGKGAKITLRTPRSSLNTSFTDDNGEFRFIALQRDTYCSGCRRRQQVFQARHRVRSYGARAVFGSVDDLSES
ncbi:MAG: carboxypeptidase-like regulatory domain-containing protein [Pyrinomonadaceae bacterium]